MSLTSDQKSSRLFKKSLGAAETLTDRAFFEEPKLGKSSVLPSQIWAEAGNIPTTAPSLSNGQTQGVVQYIEKLSLTHIAGSQDKAYYHSSLEDAIPFNFGDGSYNYALYKTDGTTQIAFGPVGGDWLVDTEAGVLTFYGTLPSGVDSANPPKISFYKYVGNKGLEPTGTSSGINVKDPVNYATLSEKTGITYDTGISGFTSLPDNVDGVSSFSEGDRILFKDQSTLYQNGIYVVSGTTLLRTEDSDGEPSGEVGINDYVFVSGGNQNKAKAYILSDSDATDENQINVGVDSQEWKLFSESKTYDADELAIKLTDATFGLDLDETGVNGSGLEQSIEGLRIQPTLINTINSNTSGITSLETEVSSNNNDITSLETEVSSNNNDITSLETEVSSNNSDITDLYNQVDNLTGVTSDTAGSGLTYNSTNDSLNINTDDVTVKTVSDELRSSQIWIQSDTSTSISNGTTGSTNITLTYEPVGAVSAYVNGIEYLISPNAGSSTTDMPFFFDVAIPTSGSTLNFDATEAGFGIDLGDLIVVKYNYIDES